MAGESFDFAICGASPFAGLVAGLLAVAHNKRVCLVGDPWSPYRLPRGLDISVMPATRPETWAMLRLGTQETLKLVGTLGRGLVERVDPLFVAETRASADYLGHMRWVALGMGFSAERATDASLTEKGWICRIRDASILVAGRAEPAIETWLERSGVHRVALAGQSVTFRRDGTLVVGENAETVTTARIVLADDDAILAHTAAADRHRLLGVVPAVSVATEPARPLSAAVVDYLDRGVVLHQRAGKGPITAIASGDPDTAIARLGSGLQTLGSLQRVGQAVHRRVVTADGAPLVVRLGRAKPVGIAGLGASAAFLAPIVARVLAGTATEEEQAYFSARDASRATTRAGVADAVPDATIPP